MIAEHEATPATAIQTIASYLGLERATDQMLKETLKEQKVSIFRRFDLASDPLLPEGRFNFPQPKFEDVNKELVDSLTAGDYVIVRLTLPGMEKTGTNLFISQLFAVDDIKLTKTGGQDDIVFEAVRTRNRTKRDQAKLSDASRAEMFTRPLSEVLEVSGLMYDQPPQDCRVGGAFMVTLMGFPQVRQDETWVSLRLDATLMDTSKRSLFDRMTPQISRVLNLPLNEKGMVFPQASFVPRQRHLAAVDITHLIGSQVLGRNGVAISKLFAAMAEIYPQPGANQIAGVYSAQPGSERRVMRGYVTDFESLDMPLILAQQHTSKENTPLPDPSWPQYMERQDFYYQFRKTPLANLIRVPKASVGYSFTNYG